MKAKKNNNILAIIPARGGSKGIKNKNLAQIGKTNLIARAIQICKKSSKIDKIIVSTDSEAIAREAIRNKIEVPFYRSKKNSSAKSKIIEALKETVRKTEKYYKIEYDVIVVIEPTSPLRSASEVDKAIQKFTKNKFNALWTVSKVNLDFHPYKQLQIVNNKKLKFYFKKSFEVSNRQELKTSFMRNGVCYVYKKEFILKSINMFSKNTGYLLLNN